MANMHFLYPHMHHMHESIYKRRDGKRRGVSVGEKAVNAENHTTFCDVEEPAYRRNKARYAHTERDTERGTKNISIHKMQQLQIRTTNLYKRLQGHFI